MSIYLKNATLVDWRTSRFKKTHLKVSDNEESPLEFIEIIPKSDRLKQNDRIIDCSNKLVLKSLACAHHHAYSALAMGMPIPTKKTNSFLEILKNVWWVLDKSLDHETIEVSALATALSCAKNGVTFVVDHHSSPMMVEGSLEIIENAFEKVGISHLLCYELSDRDGDKAKEKALAESENHLKSGKQGLIGLHASFTVGDELLIKAVELAEKYHSGIHSHAAEDLIDQKLTIEKYKCRVIERIRRSGALSFNKTILAHCVHLDENERKTLRNSPAWIAQNPDSNLNNAVGAFNGHGLGDRIILGTDGMHSNMIRSTQTAFLIGRKNENIDFHAPYHRLRRVHDYISENTFLGDADNNLLIINYQPRTELNENNFISHFLYGFSSRDIETVISSGKIIVEDGKLMSVDEQEILTRAKKLSQILWRKMEKGLL